MTLPLPRSRKYPYAWSKRVLVAAPVAGAVVAVARVAVPGGVGGSELRPGGGERRPLCEQVTVVLMALAPLVLMGWERPEGVQR